MKRDDMEQSDLWPEGEVEIKQPWLPPTLRKWLLIASAILVLALMLFAFLIIYPAGGILRGKLESTLLRNDMLELEEFTIYFGNGTARQLEQLYIEEQKVEFSVCLQGMLERRGSKTGSGTEGERENERKDYYITSLYVPRMYRQAFNQVSFEPCRDSLIILHTHPYKSCLASAQDLTMLEKSRQENNDVLMVVMCEPRRFSVYS